MRKVKKWRYYCDHCGKGGCSGGHIAKHERGCCANPARVCGVCKAAELAQQPMDALIAAFRDGGIDKLRETARKCHACMLAAIIQDRKQRGVDMTDVDDAGNPPEYVEFDYKKEHEAFWAAINDAEWRREARCEA